MSSEVGVLMCQVRQKEAVSDDCETTRQSLALVLSTKVHSRPAIDLEKKLLVTSRTGGSVAGSNDVDKTDV